MIHRTEQHLHYFELSPLQFQELCYWLLESRGHTDVDHLGAAGREKGCDLVSRGPDGKRWVTQCMRVQSFGRAEALKRGRSPTPAQGEGPGVSSPGRADLAAHRRTLGNSPSRGPAGAEPPSSFSRAWSIASGGTSMPSTSNVRSMGWTSCATWSYSWVLARPASPLAEPVRVSPPAGGQRGSLLPDAQYDMELALFMRRSRR